MLCLALSFPCPALRPSGLYAYDHTRVHAAIVQVWGRDEISPFTFKQQDIDLIVAQLDHHGPYADAFALEAGDGQSILSLTIGADANKSMLLKADGFLPLLVSSLLLDPEHPRRHKATANSGTDFDQVKGPFQRDFAEAIAQLAMYPPGADALRQDPSVAEALRQVVTEGWEAEARQHAQSALAALFDRQPGQSELLELHEQGGHVMLSYRKPYRSHCITNASCALQACRSWLASYAAVLAHLRHTQADTAAPCDLPQNGTRRQL